MTFAQTDGSTRESRPLFLYRFARGTTVYRRTGRASDWTAPANLPDGEAEETTWLAAAIAHSDVRVTSDVERLAVDITLPLSDTLASVLSQPSGTEATSLTIWRGQEDVPDAYETMFVGALVSVRVDGRRRILTFEPKSSALRRGALRRRWARLCPHPLYAGLCGLDIEDFYVSATATAITGRTATVTEAANEANGVYAGGVLRFGTRTETIQAHNGDQLVLLGTFPELEAELAMNATAAVDIAPGCDRTLGTCNTRFDNLANNGATPFIPGDNPLDGTKII